MLSERKMRNAKIGFFKMGTRFTGEVFMDPIGDRTFKELIDFLSKKSIDLYVSKDKFINNSESAIKEATEALSFGIDAAIIFISSWVESTTVITLVKELKDLPILFWSFPQYEDKDKNIQNTGSYVGSIVSKVPLNRVGRQFEAINSFPDKNSLEILYKFIMAARAKKLLDRAKIGMIGFFAIGMYNGTADELLLRYKLGPEIIPVYEIDFLDKMKNADKISKNEVLDFLNSNAFIEPNVKEDHLDKISSMHVAFEELINEYNLDAIVIRCHSDFSEKLGMTGCIPYSIIADKKIIVGCESDIMLTTTMLMQYYLSNEVITYGDLQYFQDNTIVFSPCGTWPCSLSKDKILLRYLEFEKFKIEGVINSQIPISNKTATVSRLNEKIGSYEMVSGTGKIVNSGVTRGCFPTIYLKPDSEDGIRNLEKIITGHHFSITYKDISKEIEFLNKILNIELNQF